MAQIDQIFDYDQFNTPPYLLEQFKGTDVDIILKVPNRQFNDFEVASIGMLAGMWIENGVGQQLANIGIHLGLSREGRGDSEYKILLLLKAKINTSGGTPEILLETVRFLYEATVVHYALDAPGKIIINQNGLLGLLIYFDALFNTGDYIALDDGSTLQFTESDVSAVNILNEVIPSGVGLTVNHI